MTSSPIWTLWHHFACQESAQHSFSKLPAFFFVDSGFPVDPKNCVAVEFCSTLCIMRYMHNDNSESVMILVHVYWHSNVLLFYACMCVCCTVPEHVSLYSAEGLHFSAFSYT